MLMNWYDIFAFSLSGAILVIMALGIVLSAVVPSLDKWSRRYFVTLFSLLFLCTVSCFLALIFWYDPTMAAVERVIYLFEDIFLPASIFMPTIFLLHFCGENIKKSALFKIVTALLGAYIAILLSSQFTDVFYYVTADNEFVRGLLWTVAMAPMAAMLILNIIGAVRRRKKLSKKYFSGLMIYMVPMAVAVILHMFIEIDVFVVSGMALFALIMYGLILSDNIDQYTRQQREIAHQRASVMVLQMRPHFIYNTMTTIYYLCKQDADKAQQVTLDFIDYLRQNFNAIASEDAVPFADELKHTQSYLAVEKAQHENNLFVEFDTPVTWFRLPPLTLQPLVENSVKHGMDPNAGPLTISVRTEQTDAGILITVEDDGRGFDPNDKSKPHPALDNIENRLKQQCGGSLTVSPRKGGGTSVKIRIPAARSEEE